jgi:hypothetical protein
MPESLTIATFVFGAVLTLLSLVGGGFKLFGAEVPGTAGTLGRTVAFVLGGVLITVGLLREGWLRPQPGHGVNQQNSVLISPSDVSKPVKLPEPPPQPPQPLNLSGIWQEIYPNPGTISHTTQDGNTFRCTIQGAIQGWPFQSSCSGTIRGQSIESTYQSTIPSMGRCSGTVSSDGMQITSTCIDSVYGQFITSAVRQGRRQ